MANTRTLATAPPRLPLNTLGIAFGLSGLAGTWTAAHVELGIGPGWGETLWAIAALAWVITIVRYLARPGGLSAIVVDLTHPVLGPFAALAPVVVSLIGAHVAGYAPTTGAAVVAVMAVLSAGFGAWFTTTLFVRPRPIEALHGGYLLPTVAASLLTAQSLATVGARTLAIGFFAAGVLFWLLVEGALLFRFATGPALPGPLLPTLAIFSAPPAVAGNAWWAINAGHVDTVERVLAGLMVALLLPHAFLVARYLRTPFTLGFWALTFTTAASATFAVRLLIAANSPWGITAAWAVIAVATLVVAAVAARSLLWVVAPIRRLSRGVA
jgi:tellurite resistance protein TehA-like permease